MRIPRSRIYRAFSELDRFTDVECERLLQRIRVASRYPLVLFFALVVAAVVSVTLCVLALELVTPPLHRWIWLALSRSAADNWTLAMHMVAFAGIPSISLLLARDRVVHVYLRRALYGHLQRVRCPQCKYVLLGQRVNDGAVLCPECGEEATLTELGVTEADLLPRECSTQEVETGN